MSSYASRSHEACLCRPKREVCGKNRVVEFVTSSRPVETFLTSDQLSDQGEVVFIPFVPNTPNIFAFTVPYEDTEGANTQIASTTPGDPNYGFISVTRRGRYIISVDVTSRSINGSPGAVRMNVLRSSNTETIQYRYVYSLQSISMCNTVNLENGDLVYIIGDGTLNAYSSYGSITFDRIGDF